MKSRVRPPDKAVISSSGIPMISPDGRRVAFVATLDGKNEVWVRELDSLTARVLPGTDGAFDPFWSPDSRSIGFFAGAKLKRIDVAGGPAQTLCDAAAGRGGSWNQNNVIVFGVNNGGIFRVPAAGGTATPATTPDRSGGEVNHRFPWFLPDGHHFLFAAQNADPERVAMEVGDLDSKQVKHIASVYSNAEYAPPGYLLLRAAMTGPSFPIRTSFQFRRIASWYIRPAAARKTYNLPRLTAPARWLVPWVHPEMGIGLPSRRTARR
jgi:hypothetical protein